MIARLLLIAAFVTGLAALGWNYLSPIPEVAVAQSSDDLLATVTALQTQVAEQDSRISKLEEEVARLLDVQSPPNAGSDDATKETHSITGSVTLSSLGETDISEWSFLYPAFGPGDCIGWRGYDDIIVGADVVIVDGGGTTIAKGELGPGAYDEDATSCTFEFTVEDVPTSDFYSVRVGHRDGPTYTFKDLEGLNWAMDLSLG